MTTVQRTATLNSTEFSFPGITSFYRGKVRDVYTLENDLLILVTSDRISAFDVVLPEGIPQKGEILNQVALQQLDLTSDIIPNWVIGCPHPNVLVGHKCEPYKVEMVVRGYLAGHAWRVYKSGKRSLCGVTLPEGLRENEKLPQPIITPTTKAEVGHDEDISREDVIASGLVSREEYEQLEKYALALFERGTRIAATNGLILVDTKYEFGKDKRGRITLIDEIHTPDSSRFFYGAFYKVRLNLNLPQRQLSKEFVREWLMENGYTGQKGQTIPEMKPEFVVSVSERYIELYEKITGNKLPASREPDLHEIESCVVNYLQALNNQNTNT